MATNKPYHLMTPAERLAHRIEQNRKIEEKAKEPASTVNKPSGSGIRVDVSQSFSIRKIGRS
jgi:hypothetical protein